jgi:hypothetical protein
LTQCAASENLSEKGRIMNDKTPVRQVAFGLLMAALACVGCARYVNPDITDPRESRSRLAADKSLCQALANERVPPSYGADRYGSDPTFEGQADQYVADVLQDDVHDSVFDRCLRDRGWRLAR